MNFCKDKVRRFKSYVGSKVWRLIILSSVVGLFWFLVESSFVFILQAFLTSLNLIQESQLFLPPWFPKTVGSTTLILVLFGLFRGLTVVFKTYISGLTQQEFLRNQRSKMLNYGLKNAQKLNSSEVVSIFTERISQAGLVLQHYSLAINSVTSSFCFVLFCFKLAPLEFVLSLIFLALFLMPFRLMTKEIQKSGEGLVKEWDSISRTLILGFKNSFFLRLYNLIEDEIARGEASLTVYQQHFKKFYVQASARKAGPVVAGVVIMSLITFLSYSYIHTNSMCLVSFLFVFIRLAQSMSDASSSMSEIRLQSANFRELQKWSLAADEFLSREGKDLRKLKPLYSDSFVKDLSKDGASIEVHDLAFRYQDDGPFVFEGINFKISRGQVLLIRGHTGSGKSTLLSVLLGLNSAKKGTVKVNGYLIQDIRSLLPEFIGYVGPEPYLIQGTVRENLLYGHPNRSTITDSEIHQALLKAEIFSEIINPNRGLEYRLNEQSQLSTGQRQRLSIARALLRSVKWLILDEATANLDSQTERRLVDTLRKISKDMVITVVSHKDCFNDLATVDLNLFRSGYENDQNR